MFFLVRKCISHSRHTKKKTLIYAQDTHKYMDRKCMRCVSGKYQIKHHREGKISKIASKKFCNRFEIREGRSNLIGQKNLISKRNFMTFSNWSFTMEIIR